MRPLQRNQREIWYAPYDDQAPLVPILDPDGYETGEYVKTYGKPTSIMVNVSAARGKAEEDMFGVNAVYDKTLNPAPPDCPIDEYSILWIDTPPVMREDGSTRTPPDYVMERVAASLNHKAYAVRKVSVGEV